MALTQRIELRVDDEFVDALTALASRLGKTRAEIIRDALNHYHKDVCEWDKVHSINKHNEYNENKAFGKAEPCVA
jgi:predicted DNA-binding protein